MLRVRQHRRESSRARGLGTRRLLTVLRVLFWLKKVLNAHRLRAEFLLSPLGCLSGFQLDSAKLEGLDVCLACEESGTTASGSLS